jgi:hypothetical protein
MNLRLIPRLAVALALGLAIEAGPGVARAEDPAPFPPPRAPKDTASLGLHIQRSMTLLATSTPEHRNKVRILFYGQSITEQGWWEQVVADLRRRFPDADLEVENRAIGGFASQLLVRPAEHDVYPYYPDLVIFHVYGDHRQYENIIRSIRSRTAAEVLMQTDHVTKWPPEPIESSNDAGAKWDHRMHTEILPGIARKYGCGLADIRSAWTDYLKENKLEPSALLADDVHLNDHGKYLMAELIKARLVYRPDLPSDDWRGLARTFEVGKDVSWKEGRLSMPFQGNRVDVIAADSAPGSSTVRVLVDGKKPSEFPGAYAITRPTPNPWSALALVRVDHDRPLLAEDWTLTVTSFQDNPPRWQYRVDGSKTGPDGSGDNASTFRSNSGRVRIEPESWFQKKPVEPGYQVRWTVRPLFADSYIPPKVDDPSREQSTTLIQGLPNGSHTLELVAESSEMPAIRAIRVYDPPIAVADSSALAVGAATTLVVALALILTARRIRANRRPVDVTTT